MNLARGYRLNCNQKIRQMKVRPNPTIGLGQDPVLMIKLPISTILGIFSKSLFLAMVIVALPSIGSFIKNASQEHPANPQDFLPVVLKDLTIEGLFKDGHKGLLLSSGTGDLFDSLWFSNDEGIDIVTDSDLGYQMMIPNEVFDFVFASSLLNVEFVDRVVKLDGIVVMPLGKYYDRSYALLKRSNYKIVYLRQFDLVTVVAMRKIDGEGEETKR